MPQECGKPPGHAKVPGLRVDWPHGGRQLPALPLREHVCPQQLQARPQDPPAGRPRQRPLPRVHPRPPGQGHLPQRGLDGRRPDRRHHRRELLRRPPGHLRDHPGVERVDHQPRHQGPDPAQTHPRHCRGQPRLQVQAVQQGQPRPLRLCV